MRRLGRLRLALVGIAWIAGLAGPAVGEQGPTDLRALYRSLEAPRLDAVAPAPDHLDLGRSTLRPAAGTKVYRMVADGRPCGQLFDGEVGWTHRVEDPVTKPVARRLVAKVSRLAMSEGKELVLSEELRGAAIWSWEVATGISGFEPVTPRELPGWAAERLARRFSGNPAHDMVVADQNADPRYAWVLLHGVRADYVLDWDGRATSALESLGVIEPVDARSAFRGRWAEVALATQPVTGNWWSRRRPFDLVATAADLELTELAGGRARVRAKVRLRLDRAGMRVLSLALHNEFASISQTLRAIELQEVKLDGLPAVFAHDRQRLLVALPRPASAGATVELAVGYTAEMLERPKGDVIWFVTSGDWYPHPAGPGGTTAASFHTTVETPKPLVPFAPGTTVSRLETEQSTRLVTDLAGPMSDPFLAAGKYATASVTEAGLRLHVSTYGLHDPAEMKRVGNVVKAVRGCLADLLAEPYPFAELRVLEVNEWGFGVAPPGFIFITKEAFLSKARIAATPGPLSREFARTMMANVDARLAHETAHAWFPHVAKTRDPEDFWISESFSEYLSTVCLALVLGEGKARDVAWSYQLGQWKLFSEALGADSSLFLAAHLLGQGEAGATDYFRLVYGKGPVVLHALREELVRQAGNRPDGERQFFAWIRQILAEHRYDVVHTGDLVAPLDRLTGKSWRPWFEKYVYGTATPRVD